ncbi:MAG: hypothetical protein FRX49_13320 [Trebouxia sp. A1-2]|nr:MAG: hypothetical protein FRX49_13320 [Trebouxia sp. A1-2]
MAVRLSRGAQHEDCIKLLRRLQAAQQQDSSPACLSQLDRLACKDAKLQQPFRLPPKWSSEAASGASPFPDTMLAWKSSAEQGRQLVAAHDVVAGSVLWIEEPFAHLLLKQHRKRVHTNGLAVVPQQHTDASDRIALAVYPTASLMNHSCQPNIAVCFNGCELTARATESVQAGEPLLHCYGAQTGALITPLRQQQLQEQYHFVCGCRACQAGFDESEQAMVGLRCLDSKCSGVIVPKQATPAGLKCWNEDPDSSHSVWSALHVAKAEYALALSQLHNIDEVEVRTLTAATQSLLHVSEIVLLIMFTIYGPSDPTQVPGHS